MNKISSTILAAVLVTGFPSCAAMKTAFKKKGADAGKAAEPQVAEKEAPRRLKPTFDEPMQEPPFPADGSQPALTGVDSLGSLTLNDDITVPPPPTTGSAGMGAAPQVTGAGAGATDSMIKGWSISTSAKPSTAAIGGFTVSDGPPPELGGARATAAVSHAGPVSRPAFEGGETPPAEAWEVVRAMSGILPPLSGASLAEPFILATSTVAERTPPTMVGDAGEAARRTPALTSEHEAEGGIVIENR